MTLKLERMLRIFFFLLGESFLERVNWQVFHAMVLFWSSVYIDQRDSLFPVLLCYSRRHSLV